MMNRSFDEMIRTSAGIMSPADSLIRSPGTSSFSGISRSLPSRQTVAVTLIIALSRAAAASARDAGAQIARGKRHHRQHREQDHEGIAHRQPEAPGPVALLLLRHLVVAMFGQAILGFHLRESLRGGGEMLQYVLRVLAGHFGEQRRKAYGLVGFDRGHGANELLLPHRLKQLSEKASGNIAVAANSHCHPRRPLLAPPPRWPLGLKVLGRVNGQGPGPARGCAVRAG